MKLLDEPLAWFDYEGERKLLEGRFHRLRISTDPLEIIQQVGLVCEQICMLGQSKILELYKEWGYKPNDRL